MQQAEPGGVRCREICYRGPDTCALRGLRPGVLREVRSAATQTNVIYVDLALSIDSHRDPASHACATPLAAQPVKNEAGRALLAKLDASKTTQSVVPAKRKAPPKDPKKAAQLRQVELMKMRHKAQPADPKDKNKHVPIDQKLHLKVRAEEKNVEKIFWFSKVRRLV